MAQRRELISHDELKRLLAYDEHTGNFTWRVYRGRGARVGDRAGSPDEHGYVNIVIGQVKYKAHRLAWFYANLAWPVDDIDHINHIKGDNRLSNLRCATRSQNLANRRDYVSSTGFRGVTTTRTSSGRVRYVAQIGYISPLEGKQVHRFLGHYDTPEEAHEVYELAAKMIHGEYHYGTA